MTTKLEQLRQMTTVVVDTGNIEAVKRLHPVNATTNPTLLLKAAQSQGYRPWLEKARKDSRGDVSLACDLFAVTLGQEILKLISGEISTEVDARLSFDTQKTVERGKRFIQLYEQAGVDPKRVLIKIAATWEGIQAAAQLEAQGIKTNMTLLFSFAQAVACAQAKVFLISPFVGRIYDWYKKNENRDYAPQEDPGVLSVTRIYHYYRQHAIPTIVMGASFRTVGQIEQLAGCDSLTISPPLLDQLEADTGELKRKLLPDAFSPEPLQQMTEGQFRWALNEDAMATEKLAEGLRGFAKDQRAIEELMSNN